MTQNIKLKHWLTLGTITCLTVFLLRDVVFKTKDGSIYTKKSPAALHIRGLRSINNVKEDMQGRYAYQHSRLADPNTHRVPAGIRSKELTFSRQISENTANQRVTEQNWAQRGPFNIGGRTRALAIDISNEQVILAGGASGGMWRSENGGTTWSKTNSEDLVQSTTAIVQDTRTGKTNTWYYGTGELRGNTAAGGVGAVYRGNGTF